MKKINAPMKAKFVLAVLLVFLCLSLAGAPALRAQERGEPAAEVTPATLHNDAPGQVQKLLERFFPGKFAERRAPGEGEGNGPMFPRLLPLTLTDVEVTMDRMIDVTLQSGVLITGTIDAPGRIPNSVVARNGAGAAFPGAIRFFGQRYLVAVPPGDTYTLTFCLITPGPGAPTLMHEDLVTVKAVDVTRDEISPGVMTRRVSGTITGRDPMFPFASAVFASADGRAGSVAIVDPAGGYSVSLPDGTYGVGWVQLTPDGQRFLSQVLGSVEVAGMDVIFNAAAPPTSQLAGVVSRPDAAIPSGATMGALDATFMPGRGCASPVFNGGMGPVDPGAGGYSMQLTTGPNYNVSATLPILPPDPPQSAGLWTYFNPGVEFLGDVTLNLIYPATPGAVNVMGVIRPDGNFLVHARSTTMVVGLGGGRIIFDRYASTSFTKWLGSLLVGHYQIDHDIDMDRY